MPAYTRHFKGLMVGGWFHSVRAKMVKTRSLRCGAWTVGQLSIIPLVEILPSPEIKWLIKPREVPTQKLRSQWCMLKMRLKFSKDYLSVKIGPEKNACFTKALNHYCQCLKVLLSDCLSLVSFIVSTCTIIMRSMRAGVSSTMSKFLLNVTSTTTAAKT